ncbi:hypothetical protein V8D89_005096 [Ganoderma adspersum]
MRLEPCLHTHSKLSTRDQPSSLRDCLKRQEKKSKLSSRIPPSGYPVSDAERDIANSDVDVDNYLRLFHSLGEAWEPFIDDAVAQLHNDQDTSRAGVDRMLSAPSLLSSTPLHLFRLSPRTGTGETPSPRDGFPEDFGRPSLSSLQRDSLKALDEHGGGASGNLAPRHKVVTNLVEGQYDVMAPPSSVDMARSCGLSASPQQDGQKRPLIIFYGEEPDEAELYTTLDYMVEPDVPRREDEIANMLASDCSNGLTRLDVSFECHGFRSKDDGSNWARRRDAIVRAVRWLGAILGGSLSGLKVTAPWPELMFPCVPDILEVILDSFPGLESLHFADLKCECDDCKSVYTVRHRITTWETSFSDLIRVQDDAKFKRLHVSALAHRVSGPLRSTGSLRVTIGRRSMHSLGKDYTKYTGNNGRLADEAILGTWTVSHNGGESGATAHPQDEAQFFIKLLKRDLPSAMHFSVENPGLRVTYDRDLLPRTLPSLPRVRTSKSPAATTDRRSPTPFPPPLSSALPSSGSHTQMLFYHESNTPLYDTGVAASVTDTSLELNEDVWPQDDISDKPGQEMVEAAQFSRTTVSTEGDQSPAQDFEPDGPGDANLTFREVGSAVHESDVDWSAIFMSPQEGDFDGRHGNGICIDSEQVLWPFLSPASSSRLAASMFGSQDLSETRPYISGGYDPGQGWADSGDFNYIAPNIAPDNPVNRAAPPACLQLGSSTDLVTEEFRPEIAQERCWTWLQPDCGTMLSSHAELSTPKEDSDSLPYGYPATERWYSDTSRGFKENRESDSGTSGEDITAAMLGDTAQVYDIQRGLRLEGDTVMISHETVMD